METWQGLGTGDDMGQVVVDALDVCVPGGNHLEGGTVVATDIYEHLHIIETTVDTEKIVDDDAGVAPHASVEHLVEPWICAYVIEHRHPVGGVQRDDYLQNGIL